MANLSFNRVQSRAKELKHLNAEVTIGSTGAPTLVASKTNGVASISRTDVGEYTITLADKFTQLIDCTVTLLDDTLALNRVQLIAEAVSTDKTISFQIVGATATADTAPVAEELASGAKLFINVWLKNTSAK